MNKKTALMFAGLMASHLFGAETETLNDVTVIGEKVKEEKSLHVEKINLGGLLKGEKRELPMNSETLSAKLLEDRYTTSFYDALQYTSGIFTGGKSPTTRTSGQFTMRGFSGSDTLLNGMAMPGAMSYFLDSHFIQNIDIFRGPLGAITGGQTSSLGPYGCGGSINVVSKQAELEDTFQKLSLGGTYSDKGTGRTTYDGNFAVNENFSFRLPVAYEQGRPDYLPSDYDSDYTFSIAPSFLWKLGADTDFKIMTNYQKSDTASYQGIPYLKENFLVPTDFYYGTEDSRNEYEMYSIQGQLDHRFSRKLSMSLGGGYAKVDLDREQWSVSSGVDYEDLSNDYMAPLSYSDSSSVDENYSLFAHLNYDLEMGTTVHHLTLGVDWLRKDSESTSNYGSTPTQDIRDPDYTIPTLSTSTSDTTVDRYGILVQDFVEMGKWRLMLGTRFDQHESDAGNSANSTSPRIGLTYLVNDDFSIYTNFVKAEAPNFGYYDKDGNELDDSWDAESYELGIKHRVGDNLWVNANIFQIDQNNTPESDESTPYPRDYITGAENRSRGFEMSLSGELNPNWSFAASYTFTKYEDLDADISFEKVPEHSLALWTSYRFPGGFLKDLKMGLGWRYQSKTYTTFRGSYVGDEFEIEAANIFDLNFEYPVYDLFGSNTETRFQVGIKNLFDEEYVESARHGTENFAGDSRTLTVNMIVEF